MSIRQALFLHKKANYFFLSADTNPGPATHPGIIAENDETCQPTAKRSGRLLPWPFYCEASKVDALRQSSCLALDNMMLIYSSQHIQNPVYRSGYLGWVR